MTLLERIKAQISRPGVSVSAPEAESLTLLREAYALIEAQAGELEEARHNQKIAGGLAHPWYGPCDALAEGGRCAECERLLGRPEYGLFRHLEHGGKYKVQGYATLKGKGIGGTHTQLVVYESGDGQWWAREKSEFDIKFEPYTPTRKGATHEP